MNRISLTNRVSLPAFGRITVLALVILAVCAVPAFAQSDPTAAQYDDQVTQVAGGGGSDTSPAQGTSAAPQPSAAAAPAPALEQNIVGGLPITGLDVFALAAVAIALTLMGFALRRMTSLGDDQS